MEFINTINNDDFRDLFSKSKNISDLAVRMGYKKMGNIPVIPPYIYDKIRKRCEILDLDYESLSSKGKKSQFDTIGIEVIKNVVKKSKSIRDVILGLGLETDSGSVHNGIKKLILKSKIDISHFGGACWSKNKNRFNDQSLNSKAEKQEIPWKEAFKKHGTGNKETLMKRLILSGKREYKCSICGINKWSDKPIRLRLDHIDGDNSNNEEQNLRFLCPNCDSQTDTFCRGKRTKKYKTTWWQYIVDPKCFEKSPKIKDIFSGDNGWRHNPKPMQRKVKDRPSEIDLKQMIETMSWCAIGRKYSVSDNAVRKWAKQYNLI